MVRKYIIFIKTYFAYALFGFMISFLTDLCYINGLVQACSNSIANALELQ